MTCELAWHLARSLLRSLRQAARALKTVPGDLARQVATIIERRNALGEPITRWSISKELGIPLTRLRRYPPVKLLLYQVGAERQVNLAKRFELRGDELLEQVQLAVESLEAKGSPITPSA